ncbi:hypothetical protein B0H13DRAFT_2361273 [Mycena leptocephala]|nr:hypothetical protein B0H13DRAFT_2361273 [Mycena leptocephala]
MSFLCRAKTNDGEACDCEEYDEPQDPRLHRDVTNVATARKVAGKKKAPNSKPKDTSVKVVLLTCGVKNVLLACGVKNKELRISRAPTLVDLKHMALHGCVATGVRIGPDSTYDECTEHFAQIFPNAFSYANTKRKTDSGLWMVVAKNYQTLRLVPNMKPTGADLIEFKSESSKKDVSIFIAPLHLALTRSVPDKVYNSWNEGSIAWQEQSSDIQDDELLYSDGSQIEDGSSDYDPMKDPDADGLKTAHLPTGRYETRLAPVPSIRKRESMAREDSDSDSDIEQAQPAAKKQKLASGRPYTAQIASSSCQSEPLFLPSDSISTYTSAFGKAQSYSLSRAGPSTPKFSQGNYPLKCACQKVSPPPTVIRRTSCPSWDHDGSPTISPDTYINPWNSAYKPPAF